MAEKSVNHASDMDQAEGERWSSDDDQIRGVGSEGTEIGYHPGRRGSGISNRAVGDEIENQQAVPERGTRRSDEQEHGKEDLER